MTEGIKRSVSSFGGAGAKRSGQPDKWSQGTRYYKVDREPLSHRVWTPSSTSFQSGPNARTGRTHLPVNPFILVLCSLDGADRTLWIDASDEENAGFILPVLTMRIRC